MHNRRYPWSGNMVVVPKTSKGKNQKAKWQMKIQNAVSSLDLRTDVF